MKAIIYGPSNTLQMAEIEKPVPADDEVLVRVHAASVNPLDGHLLKTAPIMRNLMLTAMGTRVNRPGADVAGEVEAVGKNVTRFLPGDAVFGASGGGAFAEYACPPESRLAQKPQNVSFESAACLNVAGRTALQGIRDIAAVGPDQKVIVIGASGGVGTFAVQIAKWLGAEVSGVCSTPNLDMVRKLGADHVIDYTLTDFSKSDERYDTIYDLVGDKPLLALKNILTPKGIYVGAGVLGRNASMPRMLAGMFNGTLLSLFTSQKFVSFMVNRDRNDLPFLGDLVEKGNVKTVIDRTFSLDDTAEAIRYVDSRRTRGKVVVGVRAEIGG